MFTGWNTAQVKICKILHNIMVKRSMDSGYNGYVNSKYYIAFFYKQTSEMEMINIIIKVIFVLFLIYILSSAQLLSYWTFCKCITVRSDDKQVLLVCIPNCCQQLHIQNIISTNNTGIKWKIVVENFLLKPTHTD